MVATMIPTIMITSKLVMIMITTTAATRTKMMMIIIIMMKIIILMIITMTVAWKGAHYAANSQRHVAIVQWVSEARASRQSVLVLILDHSAIHCGATCCVKLSTSAYLANACNQHLSSGSNHDWCLNFRAIACGIS